MAFFGTRKLRLKAYSYRRGSSEPIMAMQNPGRDVSPIPLSPKQDGASHQTITQTRIKVSDPFPRRLGSFPVSNPALLLTLFIVTLWLAGPAYAQKSSQSRKNLDPILEENIFRYTNEERRGKGLPALQRSKALRFVARKQSSNMCHTQTFRHESKSFPKGWETFTGRLEKVGLKAGGENIGYRTLTRNPDDWARKVVRGWMESPGHRKNILNPKFRYLGVGISGCETLGYATQVFSPDKGTGP